MLICRSNNSNTPVYGHKLKKKNHSTDDRIVWLSLTCDDSGIQSSQSDDGLIVSEPRMFWKCKGALADSSTGRIPFFAGHKVRCDQVKGISEVIRDIGYSLHMLRLGITVIAQTLTHCSFYSPPSYLWSKSLHEKEYITFYAYNFPFVGLSPTVGLLQKNRNEKN